MKLAAAPISWGVCEVPGWGAQVSNARVLNDAAALGFRAIEAGPPGFLPASVPESRRLLEGFGLRLIGGFVTAVLHDPSRRAAERDAVRRQAEWLAALGAEVLVLAAATGAAGYEARPALDDRGWNALFAGIAEAEALARGAGLAVAVHPHVGTLIEGRDEVERFLAGSAAALCLDTGHLFLGGADPVALAREAAGRIRHVHLKDVRATVAARVRSGELSYAEGVKEGLYTALGQGDLDIEGVHDRLRGAGYEGWFVLEQDTALTAEPEPHTGPAAAARQSLEYFRRVAGAIKTTSAIKEDER